MYRYFFAVGWGGLGLPLDYFPDVVDLEKKYF